MARPLRIEMEDGLYHVTVRGWERRVIVDQDRDREDWLRLLDRVATRSNWRVFAWVLMNNHFHLFLRTPDANLSAGMHDLNSGYASLFNRRYRRVGSLYQGRFKAVLVENETHAWELTRYLHLNPVRAKMVDLPEDYLWSSYRVYRFARDAAKAPIWLDWETVLSERSKKLRTARRAYQHWVEQALDDLPASPLRSAVGGVFLGRSRWVEAMRERLAAEPEDRNVPQQGRLRWRVSPLEIKCLLQRHFQVSSAIFEQTRRHGNDARIAGIYLVRRLTDQKVAAIAEDFGAVSMAAISKAIARAELRRQEDPKWNRLLADLEKQLLGKSKTAKS